MQENKNMNLGGLGSGPSSAFAYSGELKKLVFYLLTCEKCCHCGICICTVDLLTPRNCVTEIDHH